MTLTVAPSDDVLSAIRSSWDADAATYDTHPTHGLSAPERLAWQRLLGATFAPLGGATPTRVLDVGTGTGEMALVLATMGFAVTGVDLSPAMLARARAKASRQGLSLTLLEGRADRLPLPDASVDALFSRHLFWTLPDPLAAVREWARVVRPGGLVSIADGWWGEPSRQMRIRRAIGAALRRAFRDAGHQMPGYAAISSRLPIGTGISPYSVRYYLSSADLQQIRVRDLRAIRAAERRALPLWRWIDQARYTWLATAYRPDADE
jgi:SAM-dependent methyltransferase